MPSLAKVLLSCCFWNVQMKPTVLIAAALVLVMTANALAQFPPIPPQQPPVPSLPSISLAPLGTVRVGDIYHVCGTTQNIANGSVVRISVIKMFSDGTFELSNLEATVSGGAFCSVDIVRFPAVGSFYLGVVYTSPGPDVVQANAAQPGMILP